MTLLETLRSRPAPKWLYAVLSGAILVTIALFIIFGSLTSTVPALPKDFRIPKVGLSGLPVQISDVRSCDCWTGPRGQAQRKYKFRIVNGSSYALDIGGGSNSEVRLIVALRSSAEPDLTFPTPSPDDPSGLLASPSYTTTELASSFARVSPSRLVRDNRLFAVPKQYTLWALPPVPSGLAEVAPTSNYTYPTEVAKSQLLPNEAYGDTRVGHGDWTFYIPLPKPLEKVVEAEGDIVATPTAYDHYLMFVGIAIFRPRRGMVPQLLGFAPAPSPDEMMAPYDL